MYDKLLSNSSYDISLSSLYVIFTLLGIIISILLCSSSSQYNSNLFSPMHATTCVSLVPVNFAGHVSQLFDVINDCNNKRILHLYAIIFLCYIINDCIYTYL